MHMECDLKKKNLQIDFGLISDLYGKKIAESGSMDYLLIKFSILNHIFTDPGDREDKDVRVKALDCCDRGFESLLGHGYSSFLFVVCCVGSGFCDVLIARSVESYRLYVFKFV